MPGPHPAIAATRVAVRAGLAGLVALVAEPPAESSPPLVLVACSGGADSLALAAAAAFEAPRAGVRAGAVVVDHGLQEGSAEVARVAAAQCGGLGLDPVVVVTAEVSSALSAEPGGPEARARAARYDALSRVATQHQAAAVWLAHTRDDQAEQVLLGLARGSGTRSLAGMPARRSPYERPFLAIPREVTREACRAQGLTPWEDPMNADDRFTRVRVRRALGELAAVLGPGLPEALARTADLAREDADALDEWARHAHQVLGTPPWPVAILASYPKAVRARLWRRLAREGGSPECHAVHVAALDALLTDWRGQGAVALPGGRLVRRADRLVHIEAPGGRE